MLYFKFPPSCLDFLFLFESTKHQLRLFCTSSFFYSGQSSFRSASSSTVPCLVEFPPTCEVRVNNVQLNANLKGLKKKPGTAPPPDITKLARLVNTPNKVELVYVNSQQPVQNKVRVGASVRQPRNLTALPPNRNTIWL